MANAASTPEANEAQPPPEVPSAVVAASPQLTQQEQAKAEALAYRALQGDLEALKTFEAEVPNARTYLIEVFGNLARDTRRQIIETYEGFHEDQLGLLLTHCPPILA